MGWKEKLTDGEIGRGRRVALRKGLNRYMDAWGRAI